MQVAREGQAQRGAVADHRPLEIVEHVGCGGIVVVRGGPGRLGRAQHNLRSRLQSPGSLLEVIELAGVDVGAQRHVDRPQVPVVRQSQGEVAAGLGAPPAADPPTLAELLDEARQPVVPVVVAGDREQPPRIPCPRQHRAERADQPVAVLLHGRERVCLVPAQNEHDTGPRLMYSSRLVPAGLGRVKLSRAATEAIVVVASNPSPESAM